LTGIKYKIISCSRTKEQPAMAPVPLEGHQTPVGNNVPQEGSRGGSISLAVLIDFIIQRTYHELTVLAEL
jgi:mediator of RNA polymerase II transcription subunit 14